MFMHKRFCFGISLSFLSLYMSFWSLASDQVQLPTENYFGKMPKVYARLTNVDAVHRMVTVQVEGENYQAAFRFPPESDIWRHGSFAALNDFSPNMRVVLFPRVDDQGEWLDLRVLSDEISYQAITNAWHTVKGLSKDGKRLTVERAVKDKPQTFTASLNSESRIWTDSEMRADMAKLKPGDRVLFQLRYDGDGDMAFFSEIVTESAFKAASEAQSKRHNERLGKDGLTAMVNDVNLTTREILLTLNRNANQWALRLHQYETVQLKTIDEKASAVRTQVIAVRPDGERLKMRLTANGTQLARFSPADEIRILIDPTILVRQEWLPDYVQKQSVDEQADYLLAWLYCPCNIADLNCGGQIFGVPACTHECHMPQQLHTEVVNFLNQDLSPNEIVERLRAKYGELVMLSHLL
jgi:hypothetical protein